MLCFTSPTVKMFRSSRDTARKMAFFRKNGYAGHLLQQEENASAGERHVKVKDSLDIFAGGDKTLPFGNLLPFKYAGSPRGMQRTFDGKGLAGTVLKPYGNPFDAIRRDGEHLSAPAVGGGLIAGIVNLRIPWFRHKRQFSGGGIEAQNHVAVRFGR